MIEESDILKELREIINENGIFPKVNTDECPLKDADPNQSHRCPENCSFLKDCNFFITMSIDLSGLSLGLITLPNGYLPHLLNSIELHKAGIKVECLQDDKECF